MNPDKEVWLQRYLDDELSGEEERKALLAIAEDPELRELLKFDRKLREELAVDSRVTGKVTGSLPDGFADSVMQAIDRMEQAPAASTRNQNEPTATDLDHGSMHGTTGTGASGLRKIGRQLWQPRPVMLRPVWSGAIAATLLILLVLTPVMFLTQDETEPVRMPVRQIVEEQQDRVLMRFVYVDRDAESVAVAGDFSDWEPITLTRQNINGDVAWTGIIPLERGQHRYMFLKDGERWATDPLAGRYIDDGFGNKNAVINL
jgi:hypothetical protein